MPSSKSTSKNSTSTAASVPDEGVKSKVHSFPTIGRDQVAADVISRLAASGLDPEDMKALAITPMIGAETAALELWGDKQYPAMKIPYFDALTGEVTLIRGRLLLNPLPIITNEDGSTKDEHKYSQRFGTPVRVYFPRLPEYVDWKEVLKNPTVSLIITEGELKSAKGCKTGFPTIGLGGVSSYQNKAKEEELLPDLELFEWKGRRVDITYDSDIIVKKEVRIASQKLARQLTARGATVRIVTLPEINGRGVKVGLDDFLLVKTASDFRELLKIAVPPLPPNYVMRASGLYYAPLGDGNKSPPEVHVCGPFEIVGATLDGVSENHGLMIRWNDRASFAPHEWVIPRSLTASPNGEIVMELLDKGLFIPPTATVKDLLRQFIAMVESPKTLVSVACAGWHRTGDDFPVFVLPNGDVIGGSLANDVVMQSEAAVDPTSRAFHRAGDLSGWQKHVGALAVGNDRMVLSMSAVLSGAILDVDNLPTGGIHLHGKSSTGKTTVLLAAASVVGEPSDKGQKRTWRSTANGLEGIATRANHICLFIDEMGQVEPKELSAAIYMLLNGMGKQRANRSGGSRATASWKCPIISTGEVTVETKLAEGSIRVTAGQEVRMVNLIADAGMDYGVFQNLHGRPNSKTLVIELGQAVMKYHGTAFRAFVERLAGERMDGDVLLANKLRGWQDAFMHAYVPTRADGQVSRVGTQFAVIAAAGELATDYGVMPWPRGEATRAAAALFKVWIEQRGGTGAREDLDVIAQIRRFLEAHGQSRFARIMKGVENKSGATSDSTDLDKIIHNRAGWRREEGEGDDARMDYLIMPEAWKEMCKGHDPSEVAKLLEHRGLMKPDKHGKYSYSTRIPGEGQQRVYIVRGTILQGDAKPEAVAPRAEVVVLRPKKSRGDAA